MQVRTLLYYRVEVIEFFSFNYFSFLIFLNYYFANLSINSVLHHTFLKLTVAHNYINVLNVVTALMGC